VRYLKKEWKPAAGQKPDLSGITIFILSMLAFTSAVTLLPHSGAYAAGAVGVAALGAFAWVEKKAPFPIFEVKLFRENRRFTFSSLATLISYAATYAITFMMSLYLQLVKGFTPQTAGLILIFQPLVQALFSPLSGRLSDRVDPGHIATIGMAVTTAGLLVLVFFSPATPVYLIIAALVLLGAGFGLFSSPNMNAILGSVEKRHVSIASGVVATMRLFGQMVSMVLVTIIFTFLLGQAPINSANQLIFMKSFKIVFAVAAFYSTAAILYSKAR
jgi:MFS family permease